MYGKKRSSLEVSCHAECHQRGTLQQVSDVVRGLMLGGSEGLASWCSYPGSFDLPGGRRSRHDPPARMTTPSDDGCVVMDTSERIQSEFNITNLAECHQPLLLEIAFFLSEPRDFVSLCALSSRTIERQDIAATGRAWEHMLATRLPAFHSYFGERDERNWCMAYKQVVLGKADCVLEVFDREKKLGFAMAAMPARVHYEAKSKCFVAKYISASEVAPESIPLSEAHRLRFCPPSARQQLQPLWTSTKLDPLDQLRYPYKVHVGFESLRVGQDVELQWKMQTGSPFGWWFGRLERLTVDPGGQTALAAITFQHFPADTRWYRLEVRFGDDTMRACQFGGFTGGIRGVDAPESRVWSTFFPKDLVTFC